MFRRASRLAWRRARRIRSITDEQSMSKAKPPPPRTKVKPADTWDLSTLYKGDAEWEAAFAKWEQQIPGYEKFRGKLGESGEMLGACLRFDASVDRAGERLGVYAFLKTAE